MPTEKILTVDEILTGLNTGADGTVTPNRWIQVTTLNLLPLVNVTGQNSLEVQGMAGIVIKTFIDTETAEIKMFLAKAIDLPERVNL